MTSTEYASVGGKLIQAGTAFKGRQGEDITVNQDYWDFGWIAPERREPFQWDALEAAEKTLSEFKLEGKTDPTVTKVDLTEIWGHPDGVAALGFKYPGTHQLTGSCVGSGGGNTIFTLAALEVLRLNDPEQIFLPWWLYTYGRSRGNSGPGDGSLESTWAQAAQNDGVINANEPGLGLPKPDRIGELGYSYTESLEYKWSAGSRSPCKDLLEKGRKHLIKKVGIMRSADDVREAICNLYPVGEGSMYGYTDWVDADGLSLGKRGPRWSHKMCVLGWQLHPKHGELFKIVNQWAGASTSSGKFNYVWVPKADIDWICRDECRCYSQFDGFPAQTFKWTV